MADDIERLRAALAARLQQMGIAPGDPRIAQLQAQAQALLQQSIAQPAAGLPASGTLRSDQTPASRGLVAGDRVVQFAPTHAATRDDEGGRAAAAALTTLPTHLQGLVQVYFQAVRSSQPAGLLGVAGSFRLRRSPRPRQVAGSWS